MKNKVILVIIIALVIIGVWAFLRFAADGPEGTWICENGKWVKHGVPSDPMPESGCRVEVNNDFCGSSTFAECSSDSECRKGGCSGQVCESINSEPIATTCEVKECYDYSKYEVECGCFNKKCQWKNK